MGPCRLGAALLILVAILRCGNAALGFEGDLKLPCMISYNGKSPFIVTCTVIISVSKSYLTEIAKTPNGGMFIIENDKLDSGKWYLDHEPAVRTSGEPNPCYRNSHVQICI
jgi:hypothetical protein